MYRKWRNCSIAVVVFGLCSLGNAESVPDFEELTEWDYFPIEGPYSEIIQNLVRTQKLGGSVHSLGRPLLFFCEPSLSKEQKKCISETFRLLVTGYSVRDYVIRIDIFVSGSGRCTSKTMSKHSNSPGDYVEETDLLSSDEVVRLKERIHEIIAKGAESGSASLLGTDGVWVSIESYSREDFSYFSRWYATVPRGNAAVDFFRSVSSSK